MVSFRNRDGRDRTGRGGRSGSKAPRRGDSPRLEMLESRRMLDVGIGYNTVTSPPTWHATNNNLNDLQNGPLANTGQYLAGLYQEYQAFAAIPINANKTFTYNSPVANQMQFQGNSVIVRVSTWGNYNSAQTALQNVGMKIVNSDSTYGIFEGTLPISQILTVAQMPQTIGLSPIWKPQARYTGFQGIGYNEALTTLHADTASNQFNVDGTGVTVGVISDSVSQFAGGLADSYKTGDLSASNPVNVLLDGPSGSSDEGRAMAENIHDIAPGASLAFSSGVTGGDTQFAQSITNLATVAKSNIIVDDLGFLDDPFFQNGIIGQAITQVVQNNNVTYFSSAGNENTDSGYLSNFRGVNATVTGVGTGTFMNFNPNGGTTTLLPLTTGNGLNGFSISATNPAILGFQFDQPWYTSKGVTSELNFYVLDGSGNIISSGTTDNTATQQPQQIAAVTTAGNYFVAIQLVKGPAPSLVEWVNFSESTNAAVSQQFGSAGGTYYPSSFGHSLSPQAIGVGAVPWWGAPPFLNVAQINNEPFSSPGPGIFDISASGQPNTPLFLEGPSISAPDGGNTSFFGFVADTSNPPFTLANPGSTGEVATSTNLSQPLPSFFGTSSAAPNAAAVAAMLKQLVPQANRQQILTALENSATPVNGQAAGTWNEQGGFGLINAVNALNAIDQLRVISTIPANGATVNTAINSLTFTFNKDVDFSTVASSDLTFNTLPPGVTVTVGTPVRLSATQILFPLSFNFPIGSSANGTYAYTLAGPITATDGKKLIPDTGGFTLADTVEPTITNTTFSGRTITVQFDTAIRQSTLTADQLVGTTLIPGSVRLAVTPNGSSTPQFIIPTSLSYNPQTNVLTIDLTGVPQSDLPSGTYTLEILHTVTDTLGNGLNGQFNGTFPSGVANPTSPSDFIQLISVHLQAPLITFFALQPSSDTGIPNDSNTRLTQPFYIGQVTSAFPAAVGGLTVLVEFNSYHGGSLDLQIGTLGRGFTGNFDLQATTNNQGTFTFQAPAPLTDGLNQMAVLVVGAQDLASGSGLASEFHYSFRVDTTRPTITSASVVGDPNLNSLSTLTFNVTDPIGGTGPFAVPTNLNYPALDPNTADNTSNYTLTNTSTNKNYSSFIIAANFISTTSRLVTSDPYTGTVTLTLAPGLPQGSYVLTAHTKEGNFTGLTDAAGNPLSADFSVNFNLQPTAAFIETITASSTLPDGTPAVVGLARSFFEQSAPSNVVPRDNAPAPPSQVAIVFSNPLLTEAQRAAMALLPYSSAIQLIRSANSPTAAPDGDFTQGFTQVQGITITLVNSVAGATPGQLGYQNELLITLPANLPADNYRLQIPNTSTAEIIDQFGNLLDGEFLGNLTGSQSVVQVGDVPEPGMLYQNLLPNGIVRANDMTGNGTPGGSFVTGFSIVPYGNVIFARPDYNYSPLGGPDYPDGTPAKPFPTLAPEAVANSANQGNLNSPINYTNFNPALDFNGDGHFNPSAFYAASVASANGPVVIVALPGVLQLNPITGVTAQQSFVLQAPIGSDGSASVPYDTTLVMSPDSALKLQNAALFIQNQGSALEALGGPTSTQLVNFTSYADHSVGNSGSSSDSTPRSGDWGGIVFRNYDQAIHTGATFPVDGTLNGPLNPSNPTGPRLAAISGADEAVSMLDFSIVNYAGGAVPATSHFGYDGVTLFASRPALTNDTFANTGNPTSTGTAQAAISANVDSLLADALAQGPLVRNAIFNQNGINGIWIRPEFFGIAQVTDAMPTLPTAPDGILNYVLNSPYPYLLTSQLFMGIELQGQTGNVTTVANRLYVNPGMLVKFIRGAGIEIFSTGSINIGDRTYMNEFDLNPQFAPVTSNGQPDPNFKTPNPNVASIEFTSAYDNLASTSYLDPITGITTTIVAASDVLDSKGANQPTPASVPDAARWGSVEIDSGAVAVITGATFGFGGGEMNRPGNTIPSLNVLSFLFASPTTGTNAYVTNNTFLYNLDAPIADTPDGIPATDALRPLFSGNPFLHGNVMIGNGINGLAILANAAYSATGPVEIVLPNGVANLHKNSVWDLTDITYVVRGTIVVGPDGGNTLPLPNPNQFTAIPTPNVTFTIQSQLGGTLLADGSTIPAPGAPTIVKLLNTNYAPPGDGVNGSTGSSENGGAGFLVGVDDGIDPPNPSPFYDPGVGSQIRILGIAGNETTHQPRVPVDITSIYDNTVGTTVRGVAMNQVIPGVNQAPKAGDGGLLYFGANSLTNYNVYDPRQGNVIDNANITYLTRIEQQSGGIIDLINVLNTVNAGVTAGDATQLQRYGIDPRTFAFAPVLQNNTPQVLAITNSNLANFSTAGILVHPNAGLLFRDVSSLVGLTPFAPTPLRFTAFTGEPAYLYLTNDTIANTPVGVRINAFTGSNITQQSPFFATILNTTFYNDNVGIFTQAPVFTPNPNNDLSYVDFIAMDSIFSNSSVAAIETNGMVAGSLAQYDLYFANAVDVMTTNPGSDLGSWAGNNSPVLGNPAFVNPGQLNFNLLPSSAAIDSSISEYGPDLVASMLQPAATQVLNGTAGVRNTTGHLGEFSSLIAQDIVTLPGYPLRSFADQWVAALPGTPGAYPGPATDSGNFWYTPIAGVRDLLGNLRQKDPNSTNIGFGSRPYFDIGAYEYRQFFPPQVIGVAATLTGTPPSATDIYTVGGIGGTNTEPASIEIQFNHQIDTTTINGLSVLLEASGNDGIFGNNNSPGDTFINLAGKLSFDTSTNILTIHLADQGLVLPDDEYRIILEGTGSNILRDPQGNALDGSNLDAAGNQKPLPSGTGTPGSNFQVSFTIGQPAISGQFVLSASTDSNKRDGITNFLLPTFTGTVVDPFLGNKPLAGQTVVIDVSTAGNGVFDQIGVGSGVTNANGVFSVSVTQPLNNSPYRVGADGTLDPLYSVDANGNVVLNPNSQDTGFSIARVRVVNASGTTVSDPNAPNAQTPLIIDTNAPVITAASPTSQTVASLDSNGYVDVSVTFNKYIDASTFTSGSIILTGSGGDGIFGNGNDVNYPIDLTTLGIQLNHTPLGGITITFRIPKTLPLPNDVYELTFKGTGKTPITDIAGNALDGAFSGTFPTGNGVAGSDFVLTFIVFSPGNSHLIFVGPNTSAVPTGTRANPFPTITGGINAAKIGDIVAVLPGLYTDPINPSIQLKELVRVLSASPSSTDTKWIPGNALETVIRSPATTNTTTPLPAVSANNLFSVAGAATEIAGFTIATALVGDPATGPINPAGIGIEINNSNVLVDKNYFIDNAIGIYVNETVANASTPSIESNVVAGNTYGMSVNITSSATSLVQPVNVINNDLVFNTVDGFGLNAEATSPFSVIFANNIVWENHDLTPARNGFGITSNVPDKISVVYNLFSGNGASETNPAYAGIGIGGNFNPSGLSSSPDALGNLAGNTGFASPRDPRPGADGPGIFFNDANFDLTLPSLAINTALNQVAPATDLLYRPPVAISGRGRPDSGPADIGAFYFPGTPATTFAITATSLAPGGGMFANGLSISSNNAPTSIIVHFSQPVQESTVTPADLVLSGTGLAGADPAQATSLDWIDSETVQFNLSGGYANSGTVNLSIPAGSFVSTTNVPISAFQDSVTLVPPPAPSAGSPPSLAPVIPTTPPPAAAPGGPTFGHFFHHKNHHNAKDFSHQHKNHVPQHGHETAKHGIFFKPKTPKKK